MFSVWKSDHLSTKWKWMDIALYVCVRMFSAYFGYFLMKSCRNKDAFVFGSLFSRCQNNYLHVFWFNFFLDEWHQVETEDSSCWNWHNQTLIPKLWSWNQVWFDWRFYKIQTSVDLKQIWHWTEAHFHLYTHFIAEDIPALCHITRSDLMMLLFVLIQSAAPNRPTIKSRTRDGNKLKKNKKKWQ